MEDLVVWSQDIEVGANLEVPVVSGPDPQTKRCRVSIRKLQQPILPFPKIFCTVCLKDEGKIVRFNQSSNLKVHTGYFHTAYDQRPFICDNCDRRFVTKQDLGYHVGKRVCQRGKISSF